jgi:thiosulfate/3-mercaptopyruvate sulfurtransferase
VITRPRPLVTARPNAWGWCDAPGLLIDAHALAGHLDDPELRVLDATAFREADGSRRSGKAEHLHAHIPGARFADLVEVLVDPTSPHPFSVPSAASFATALGDLGVSRHDRIAVYDQGTAIWATRLWWLLRVFGFDDVQVLDGGFAAWRAAGLPTSSGPTSSPAVECAVRYRPRLVAGTRDVAAALLANDTDIINTAKLEVFLGETCSPGCHRAGRIPASIHLPHVFLLDDQRRFLPIAELDQRLGEDGANVPILYCASGVSATTVAFARELAGRPPARVYAGSLVEWTASERRPVEVG